MKLPKPLRRRRRRVSHSAGLPPGEFQRDTSKAQPAHIHVLTYNEQSTDETQNVPIEEIPTESVLNQVTWIRYEGTGNHDSLAGVAERFSIHPLTLEDIATPTRPKLEEQDDTLFVVLRFLRFDETIQQVESEQVSILLRDGMLVSFQESTEDLFRPLRDRILQKRGRIRSLGSDYLLYALLDLTVDNYFVVMDALTDQLDELEDEVSRRNSRLPRKIHHLRQQGLQVRKAVWPVREIVASLSRQGNPLITEDIVPYLRDLTDHTLQSVESSETLRDVMSSLLDLHLSSISNRMNEVMKTLTIIATIFIPITFIAGIYGMNFQHMPELNQPWAYPAVLLLMLATAVGMTMYFRKKNW